MLNKEQMQQMSEADLRARVLIPLLQAMDFQDVFEYHGGVSEQGKDIVFWKRDEIDAKVNYAMVVKAKGINGQAQTRRGSAGEVFMQVSQCFGKPFVDPKTGEEQHIETCWVVSSNTISKEAVESITSASSSSGVARSIRFIDGDTLWELVEKFLPVSAVWQKLEDAGKVLNSLDTHYSLQAKISDKAIEIGIGEKFPGAANEKPFIVHTNFTFPDTPEGRAKKDEFKRHIATGAPIDIPAQYIQALEFPEFMKSLIGSTDLKPHLISIGPVISDKKIAVCMKLECNDGDSFLVENLIFRLDRVGQEEMTLMSEEHPIPVRFKLTLKPDDKLATIKFEFSGLPLNVAQLQKVLTLRKCLSKPFKLHLSHSETELPLFEMAQTRGAFEAPDENFLETVEDLVTIQNKLKRPILIPGREFSEEEIRTIGKLRMVVRCGKLVGKWTGFSVSLLPDSVQNALEGFANGESHSLFLEVEETEELFGTELPLGTVRLIFVEGKLANEQEVSAQLGSSLRNASSIELKFIPTENDQVTEEYLDWLPKTVEL